MELFQQLSDKLQWTRIYWMDGSTPAGSRFRSEIKDPPHLGWGHAFVIDAGGPRVTLYCPYSMAAYQVSRESYEYQSARAPDPFRAKWAAEMLHEKWAQAVRNGWQKDYSTCAIVLRELGLEVPQNLLPEGMEARASGGKEADDALGLTKPVKRDGRRGQVLAFFLAGEGHSRSIHEATAEMGITRSNLLSQAYLLQKDHGIGYEVAGDVLKIVLPAGCDNPFTEAS